MDLILFYIFASGVVASAIVLVSRKNPFASSIWLVVCAASLACLFSMLAAAFVAAISMALASALAVAAFVFVTAFVDVEAEVIRTRYIRFGKVLGASAAAYLAIVIVLALLRARIHEVPMSGTSYESPFTVSAVLTSGGLVPFELMGVVLLTAVVATAVLTRREQ